MKTKVDYDILGKFFDYDSEQLEFDRVTEGNVVLLLAVQFTYITDEGYTRFCFYKDLWEVI